MARHSGPRYDGAVKALCSLRPDIVCEWLQLHAAVDLAALYLDPATIDRTWEVSVMPIPSLLQRRYDEGHDRGLEQGRELGLEQGRELGLEQGFEAAAASMLRRRFGEDERIEAIARQLAPLGPDEYLRRIEEAGSLDELASA